MFNPHDDIQSHADASLHGLLSDAQKEILTDHCRVCETCRNELVKAELRWTELKQLSQELVSEKLISQSLEPVAKLDRKPFTWTEKTFWLSTAAAALVLICWTLYSTNYQPSGHDLVVYGQDQLFADNLGSMRVVLVDRKRDQPVSDATIDIDLIDKHQDRKLRLVSFITDADGTGTPEFDLPDWPSADYELQVTAHSGRVPQIISRQIRLKRDWKLMVSTDKPIYRPGQIIHVRSLALRKPNLAPTVGQKLTYRVIDPRGNVIAKQEAVTSEFGISSFDCPLATELIHGHYQIECELAQTKSVATVNVKDYVLPKFKVQTALNRTFYEPGQKISGSITARYFFDKPVFGSVDIDASWNHLPEEVVHSQAIELKDGEGKFEMPAPPVPKGSTIAGVSDGDGMLRLVMTVRDQAGQEYKSTKNLLITARPLRVNLVSESPELVTGVANRIYIFASYADGRPAKSRISIAGQKQTLESSEYGLASFEFVPPASTSKPDDRSRSVSHDDYSFVVAATDSEGLQTNQTVNLKASGLKNDFLLRTDKGVYDGGETIKLSLIGSGNRTVLLDVIKDRQTLLTRSIKMQNGSAGYELDLPAELSGTLQFSAYSPIETTLPVRRYATVFVRQASEITVNATVNQAVYRPGESANLKVKLVDKTGQPMRGAISLSVVDEAVGSVQENQPGLQQAFFETDQELLRPMFQIYPWSPNFNRKHQSPARNQLERALFSQVTDSGEQRQKRLREVIENYAEGDLSLLEVLDRPDIAELAEASWLPAGAMELLTGDSSNYSLSARSLPARKVEVDRWKRTQKESTQWLGCCSVSWRSLVFA